MGEKNKLLPRSGKFSPHTTISSLPPRSLLLMTLPTSLTSLPQAHAHYFSVMPLHPSSVARNKGEASDLGALMRCSALFCVLWLMAQRRSISTVLAMLFHASEVVVGGWGGGVASLQVVGGDMIHNKIGEYGVMCYVASGRRCI